MVMGLNSSISRCANALAYLLLSFLLLTGLVPASTAHAHTGALATAAPASRQPGEPPSSLRMPAPPPNRSERPAHNLTGLTPVRLIIPAMRLDAPILPEGVDSSGAMLAPRVGGSNDPIWRAVYWWDVGVMPGALGNAVIAGHVNKPNGSPSTFTNLNALKPGDKIEIVTASGRTLTFTVRAKNAPLVDTGKASDPTLGRIFGPALTANLNLMTCWGEWDGKEYNRRLVIYSVLDGASPFPTPPGLANFVGV